MSNLYNVKLKIGKRSYSTKFYSNSHDDILTFVSKNLEAKIVSIEKIVYEAPESTKYAIDDPTTYKGSIYFMVANHVDKKMTQIVLQTVKNSRSVNQVFRDMKTLLKLDNSSNIKSLVSANISSR